MSTEMRKYIDTFKQRILCLIKQRITESENLNISDVRNSLKKNDIVKYDGDRYIIVDIINDELWIRPLRNPYGGSYHTSPMSYPNLKVKIDNPELEFFS